MTLTTPSQNTLQEPCGEAIASRPQARPPRTVPDRVLASIARPDRPAGEPVGEGEALRVSALRRVGAAKVSHWGFPGLIDDIQLLISELLANAIEHGAGEEIGFALAYLPSEEVRIEVTDGSTALPQKRRPGLIEEHGRGVLIIDALADAWGTSDDGTTTWCSLALPTVGGTA
ncbi:ATP-binding protein [Streptomyces sp. NPDC048479]|uniref:ATP-binding protein n=1 Tax=Streptomyces sp. NPDC048479 TaxID=3154725 RepID=UPI003435F074